MLLQQPRSAFLSDVSVVIAGAGLCCGLMAFLFALRIASQRDQWGWGAAILLLTGPYVVLLVNAALHYPLVGIARGFTLENYVLLFTPAAAAGAIVGELGALLYLWILARRSPLRQFHRFAAP